MLVHVRQKHLISIQFIIQCEIESQTSYQKDKNVILQTTTPIWYEQNLLLASSAISSPNSALTSSINSKSIFRVYK